jgi:hypothetical protein
VGGEPSVAAEGSVGGERSGEGEGILSAARPGTPAAITTEPQQPALPDAAEDTSDRSANGSEDTQPIPANGSADATTQTVPAAASGTGQPTAGGSHPADQDATQRLEPVGKPRTPKGPGREGKPRT